MTSLDRLNALPAPAAEMELMQCCGSLQWSRRLAAARPFRDGADLLAQSDRVWWGLEPADWIEALNSHPRIGEGVSARPQTETARRWSTDEQAGTRTASEETRRALLELNQEYESRFGFVYVVCATGKSAEEMLAQLRIRLHNPPDTELRSATEEQRKITRIRLEKLLSP